MTGTEQRTTDGDSDTIDASPPEPSSPRDGATETRAVHAPEPRLVSRVLLTWIEVTVVGITGGLLGGAVGGPPGFIVYLVTTLLTIGLIFHNVNELIKSWIRRSAYTQERSDS